MAPKREGVSFSTDGAIECMLMVRSVFQLALRATEGFVWSVFELMDHKRFTNVSHLSNNRFTNVSQTFNKRDSGFQQEKGA